MAEWFMEGFLDRLTDPHDAASMRVLEHAVFYVVSTLDLLRSGPGDCIAQHTGQSPSWQHTVLLQCALTAAAVNATWLLSFKSILSWALVQVCECCCSFEFT